MLVFTQDEHLQAKAELVALGIKERFGVHAADAVALLGYIAMAVQFALILRPEDTSLRLAAAMYMTWRHPDAAEQAAQVTEAEPVTAIPIDVVDQLPGRPVLVGLDGEPVVRGHSPDMRPGFAPPSDADLERVLEHLREMA